MFDFHFDTEQEQPISSPDALFRRLSVHIRQRNTYVLVARLPNEMIWRKVCVPLNEKTPGRDVFLCNTNLPIDLNLHNVSSSEIWLARERRVDIFAPRPEIFLYNVVEGNCSQFGAAFLLFRCFITGMYMSIH